MVGIAEYPPRQLVPFVGISMLDFVIRAGSIYIIIKLYIYDPRPDQITSSLCCSRLDQFRRQQTPTIAAIPLRSNSSSVLEEIKRKQKQQPRPRRIKSQGHVSGRQVEQRLGRQPNTVRLHDTNQMAVIRHQRSRLCNCLEKKKVKAMLGVADRKSDSSVLSILLKKEGANR
jgi:hypothetical protein